MEDRINELIILEEKKKEKKFIIVDKYLESDEIRTKIKDYHLDEEVILKIRQNIKRKIGEKDLDKITEKEIKELLDKELVNEKILKENRFKSNIKIYVENLIKDSCPEPELTSFERDFIRSIKLNGSIDSMEEELNSISEKIIENRNKLGKIDSMGVLIEDGGYKNKGPIFDFDHDTRLMKADAIKTDVFIKIFEDKLELIEANLTDYLSLNSLNRKRLIYFKDVVLLNMGYRERPIREGILLKGNVESKSGIELSLINHEKLKLIFSEKDKELKLYQTWQKYKEKQNKADSSPQNSSNNVSEDIVKYAELYEKGLLTDEEFSALKKKLLGL